MARILYLCHDNPNPSGGIRTLYRHVEILNSGGFDAYIVHYQTGFQPRWFQSAAPVIYADGGMGFNPDDWVVVPEDYCGALEGIRNVGCRKAVFCQGHYQIFQCLAPEASWRDYGISAVIASSIPICDFVRSVFGIEPAYIPLSLDHDLFSPGTDRERPLQVAFMPRKGAHHLRMARAIVHHLAPDLRDVPWVPIDALNESEVAATLRGAAFFLATGYREGFGLPPLEAMACGAMAIGFRAGGGTEYARDDNGFWVPDEDTFALAREMIRVFRAYRNPESGRLFDSVRAAGRATAASYNRAIETKRVIEFWSANAPQH